MAISRIEKYLRRNIVGCTANCLFAFTRVFDESRETKIANLYIHIAIEKDVAELEVSVDDLVGVHVVAGTDELDHEEAGFGLGEASSSAEHVREGAVVAELEGHVDVVFVFEAVLEADDVGVLERLVDLDFCVKLGSSSQSASTVEARGESVLWFWLSYF